MDCGGFDLAGEVNVLPGDDEAGAGVIEFLDDLAELTGDRRVLEVGGEVLEKEEALDLEVFNVAQGGQRACGGGEDGVA